MRKVKDKRYMDVAAVICDAKFFGDASRLKSGGFGNLFFTFQIFYEIAIAFSVINQIGLYSALSNNILPTNPIARQPASQNRSF